jgi:hypothetical protein
MIKNVMSLGFSDSQLSTLINDAVESRVKALTERLCRVEKLVRGYKIDYRFAVLTQDDSVIVKSLEEAGVMVTVCEDISEARAIHMADAQKLSEVQVDRDFDLVVIENATEVPAIATGHLIIAPRSDVFNQVFYENLWQTGS